MSGAGVRVGVGTRFQYDGEVLEVVELLSSTTAGGDVLSKTIAAGGNSASLTPTVGKGTGGFPTDLDLPINR